ncbi:YciI family protein [Actinokineospora sp. NPDC004072]
MISQWGAGANAETLAASMLLFVAKKLVRLRLLQPGRGGPHQLEEQMAQYAVLLYSPAPGDAADVPEAELAAHHAYGDRVNELGGGIVTAAALQASTTAVSVKGELVTDGPFAETKEVLAGFLSARRTPASRRWRRRSATACPRPRRRG